MKRGMLRRGAQTLCTRVERTEHARERMRGLLGRDLLADQQALWITPCNAVHTVGMRMPIDVVFLAADGTVLAVHHVVRRNRWRAHWRARAVLELAAGRAVALALQRGQVLEFEEAA